MKVDEDVTTDVFAVIMDPKLPRARGLTAGSRTPRPRGLSVPSHRAARASRRGRYTQVPAPMTTLVHTAVCDENGHMQDGSCLLCELFIEVLEA
jgi:hypothetical protein